MSTLASLAHPRHVGARLARRLLPLAVAVAAGSSLAACSGTAVGTGGPSGTGSPAGSASSTDATGSSGTKPVPDAGTGASPYDALFGKPASTDATPDLLTGLWAGTMSNTGDDVRLKIANNSIQIAVRCGSGFSNPEVTVIGMDTFAVVSASSVRLVESKTAGTATCQIVVRPESLSLCPTGSATCFDLQGTTLYFNAPLFEGNGSSSSGPNATFTKVSD